MQIGFGVFILFAGFTGLLLWFVKSGRSPAVVPLQSIYKKILREKFSYYQQLPAEQKPSFERKVQHFIMLKRFIPREFKQVTPEMKVLIAATAVQLTFGLPDIYLRHFRKILVYPDTYYSTISKQFHKGEVNPAWGIIVLSWRNFVEGHANPGDSINLGLHEMAHALRLENRIRNSEHGFLNKELMHKWEKLSQVELAKIRSGEHHIFRDYAGADNEEFFAIAVENFFERPLNFRNHMPELYQVLSKLLNQNPTEFYGLRRAS